jgi:anaerobic magnesium-protoporphyrin IX monomethyl ester cyclase
MHVLLVGPEFEENLSLRYLVAALRQAGHTASLARFDSPEYIEGVVQQARREKPGLIGLSMVFQVRAKEFYDLARALRKAGYPGHITAGGHFATFAYEPMLKELPELDSVVRQEGEETLVDLAEALQRGAPLEELARVPGLVIRGSDGQVVAAPRRRQVDNLDSLPFPARDTPPELHLGVPTAFLVGSRGCYADCEYCCIFSWHEAALGKRYRMRSPGNIVAEMAQLYHERGIRFFVFHDDNFFLPTPAGNRKRFEALRDEVRRHGLEEVGLMLKLRPNDCDRENLLLLKEMGLLRAFVGIENASQRQLKSLGRDSTVEQVEACLDMLRELEVYVTYNIILFDPYTTLDDIATNLRFLRRHLFFPFNWCKVEPYAGTALERRFAREGRLRGNYLGCDYDIDDPRVRLMYDLLLPAFYYRNFDYYGLANLNIGLGYHRQLLRHFYPDRCTESLRQRSQELIETVNTDTLDLLERTYRFVQQVSLDDRRAIERFGEQLKRDSFQAQHRLAAQIEAALREIERAAGVRQEEPVGISEAFTPLSPAPVQSRPSRALLRWWTRPGPGRGQGSPGSSASETATAAGVSRRTWLGVAVSALGWLAVGCTRRQVPPVLPPSAQKGSTPRGVLRAAPGHSDTVAAWERFTLEAALEPQDAQVMGEPRVTASAGEIKSVKSARGKRVLMIEYQPAGGSRALDPNETITVAWTVRGKQSDTIVIGRAFVHVNDDGSYTLGYETPRPTIAEMAAPPIMQGPKPPGGGPGRRGG